jgi:hypothetical protein
MLPNITYKTNITTEYTVYPRDIDGFLAQSYHTRRRFKCWVEVYMTRIFYELEKLGTKWMKGPIF